MRRIREAFLTDRLDKKAQLPRSPSVLACGFTFGFTFIETILLLLVMAITIPSVLSSVSFLSSLQMAPMATTVAAFLGQEQLEAVMARKRSHCGQCGYASIPVGSGPFASVPGFPNYQRQTEVRWVTAGMAPSATDVGYKQVTVTVRPVRVSPNAAPIVLVTVLSSHG